jgi:hypothetical protein
MARNDDLLLFGLSQKPRQVILYLRQGDFFHFRLPNWASHLFASDFATIASTSTLEPETS